LTNKYFWFIIQISLKIKLAISQYIIRNSVQLHFAREVNQMIPLMFTECYDADWHEKIIIIEEGNKYFPTLNNQKFYDRINSRPYSSKSKKGAQGIKDIIIDELLSGRTVKLLPELNDDARPYNNRPTDNNCRIIDRPEKDMRLSSGFAQKQFYIASDVFYREYYSDYKNQSENSDISVKLTILVFESGFMKCRSGNHCPTPFYIDFNQPVTCIHCGATITAKKNKYSDTAIAGVITAQN